MSWLARRVAGAIPALLPILAALVAAGCTRDAGESPPSPPRSDPPRIVLLISVDTLRADHLGVYGYDRFTSPVIDALGAEGVVFDDASSPAPWTLPAHASMLTGKSPIHHGARTFTTRLAEGIPTLASMLSQRGYRSAAAVSVHWLKPEKYHVTRDFDQVLAITLPPERRSPSTLITDQAIEWLRDAGEDPLFLFVHYYDLHSDYASNPEFERLFVGPYQGDIDGSGWQLVLANLTDERLAVCHENFVERLCKLDDADPPRIIEASTKRLELDQKDRQHLVDLYDASIRQLDTELSRLLGYLSETGLADDALVILTSDHGEELGDHGRYEHLMPVYQEVLHVPLILRGPGVPAGVRVDAPVSLIDLVPTVLALTGGVPPPEAGLEGLDLSALWRDDEAAHDLHQRRLFGEAAGGLWWEQLQSGLVPFQRSVREGRFKLVVDVNRGDRALYDLVTDPDESRDVSDAHPEVAARLSAALEDRHGDTIIGPDDENRVIIDPEEEAQLRALGYLP